MPLSEPAPIQPSVRDQFDDLVEVGEGGMGLVLRGRDKKLGRVVAIKVIKPDLAHDPRILSRTKREVQCLARVRHPAVVQVFQFETPRGEAPFFTMEFVPGKTLWHVLHLGRMPPRKAAELVATVTDGVAAVHAAGLLHRDIKPGNIMVASDGSPKLMDFGLSTFVDSSHTRLTGTQDMLGTLAYLPPEVIAGQRADERADVFCLGLVLFEVLTGRAARERDDVAALFHHQPSAKPFRPSVVVADLDPRLDAIVADATAPDPAKRTASAAALCSALRAWLALQDRVTAPRPAPRPSVSTGRPSATGKHPVEPTTSTAVRLRRLAGQVFVALAVLAVAGSAWYRYGSRGAAPGGSVVEAALERLAAPRTDRLEGFLDDLDLVPPAARSTLAGLARRLPEGHVEQLLALSRAAALAGEHPTAYERLAQALTEVRRTLVAAADQADDGGLHLEGRLFMRLAAAGWSVGLHRPDATGRLEALLLERIGFRLKLAEPVRRRAAVRHGRGLERLVLAEALLRRGDKASLAGFEDLADALGAFAKELGMDELLSGQLLRYEKLAGTPADLQGLPRSEAREAGQRLKQATLELKLLVAKESRYPPALSPAAIERIGRAVRKARRLLWRLDATLALAEPEATAWCETILSMLDVAQVERAATLAEIRATEDLGPGFGQPLLIQESLDRLDGLFALHGSQPAAARELLEASLRWNRQIRRGDVTRVKQLDVALHHLDAGSPLRRYLDGRVLITLGRIDEGASAGAEAMRSLLAAAASSPATEPAELSLLGDLAELRFGGSIELGRAREQADEVRAVAALAGEGTTGSSPARQRLFALAALHEANAVLLAHRGAGTKAVLAAPLRRRLERVIAVAYDEIHVRKARQLLNGEVAYDVE